MSLILGFSPVLKCYAGLNYLWISASVFVVAQMLLIQSYWCRCVCIWMQSLVTFLDREGMPNAGPLTLHSVFGGLLSNQSLTQLTQSPIWLRPWLLLFLFPEIISAKNNCKNANWIVLPFFNTTEMQLQNMVHQQKPDRFTFPRQNLTFLRVLGGGQYGVVHLAEAVGLSERREWITDMFAVKTVKGITDSISRTHWYDPLYHWPSAITSVDKGEKTKKQKQKQKTGRWQGLVTSLIKKIKKN